MTTHTGLTPAEAERLTRLRRTSIVQILVAGMIAAGFSIYVIAKRDDSYEMSARSDAIIVAMSLEVARLESDSDLLPGTITVHDSGVVSFDGEVFMTGEKPDVEPLTLNLDKTITSYSVTGDDYRFCVVHPLGPWALYDSTRDEAVTSGTDDQTCA